MVRAGQGALLWVLVCAAFTFGCKSGGDVPPPPADPNKATGVVSPESTSPVVVSLPSGATVTVPPGAVSQPTTITIEKTSTQPPGASSPLYNVGPAGTQFLQPVTISIPIPAGVSVSSGATIYLSSGTQTGTYQALPTTVTTTGSGSTATAQVGQVGSVFVGQPCAEGAACATETTCRAGSQTCVTGKPACSETGLLATDGTSCGGGQICGLGTCIAPSATGTVTASGGGTVTLPGGVVVQFPPGAIPADTVVTVNVVGGAAPPGALSPVLEFLPSMTFAQPVTVSFPIAGTPPSGTTIYWSQPGTTGAWTPHLASLSTPGVASTQVTHFSLGYVGLPCTPGDACSVASACHVGAIACTSGAPVCSDTGTGRPDGTTCGSGNTCQGGSCVTPSLVGQWKGTVPGSGVAVVTIRADGTWSRATAGGPVASGAWTVAGNLIALTDDACGAGVTGTYEYTAAAGSLVLELVSDSCSSRAAVADVVLVKSTVTLCVPGASCTPAAPIACRAYATTCDATFTQTTCSPDAFLQDGTSCGSGLVCTAGACGAPPVVIDLNGTWTGTTFTATATPPGGTAGAPVTFAAAREAIQVGSAVSFTTVSSLGSESDCTGTLSGTTVSASCTIVNLDGTCSGSYSVTAPVTPGSLATWETGDVTYTWSGFSCAQAGTVVHVPTGALAPQTAPPPDISGTYSVAIDYTRTGPSPRSPQTGTSTGTRVRTQAGNFVRSMLTTPNTTYYCYGPVIGTTVYDACNGFGADGVTTFSGRLQSTITPGSPLTISGGGSYTIHGDLAGYTNLVATAVATRTGASTCTPSQTCFPYGSANPCSTYATTCSASGVQGCAAAASQAEGTSCGSSLVCSATGTCIAACVAGSGCTPAGTADPCRTYATTCNGAGTVTTCSPATNRPDGTTCGSGLVCSIGSCVAACVAGNACTPAGTPIACRAYATTCDATGTVTSCSPAANLPDGTTCGTASICSAGTCAADSASASIGVSGGSVTTLSGARLAVPASSLDATRSFQIARSASAPPAGVAAYSPVYDLAPDGVIFARLPVVTIPIPAGVAQASIYSSRLDGTGFDALEGTVDTVAHTVSAQVGHLGQAFAGAPAATRDVVGYGVTTYITPTTRTNVVSSFPGGPGEILVEVPGGGYRSIPGVVGTGAAAGTVRFSNVPVGEYLLRSGSSYSVLHRDVLKRGAAGAGGRPPSLRTDITQPTIVDIAVTGLASWQAGDLLELFAPEVDDWDFATERFATPPLAPGDVTTQLPVDFSTLNGSGNQDLVEGSKGDRVMVAQLSMDASANGVPYQRMSHSGLLPAFDQAQGVTTSTAITLSPLPRSASATFDWRGSQWRQAIDLDGNPAHSYTSTSFAPSGSVGIYAYPGVATDGSYWASADMVAFNDPAGTDAATGAMTYAAVEDALPGSWFPASTFGFQVPVLHVLPGTTIAPRFVDDMSEQTTLAAAQARPLEPRISAPMIPFVNQTLFFAGGQSMGTTPTLSWSPSRIGTPDWYSIALYEVYRVNTRTASRSVATFGTPGTSFTIPPGILLPGRNYVFLLGASASGGAPGLEWNASARVVSGIFRTSAQCVPSVACTPTGTADPCRTYTTTCDPSLTVTTCSATGTAPVGTTCGAGLVCNGSGACTTPCVAGTACTPATPDACHSYATTCDATGTVTSCSPSAPSSDGTACGSGLVCSTGTCVAACLPGGACVPSGTPDVCRTYSTTCNATLTQSACGPTGNVADGTSCGSGLVCMAGGCSDPTVIAGTKLTTFWTDAGNVTVDGVGGTVTALFGSLSSPTAYAATIAAGAFSIPGVPTTGSYWLRYDSTAAGATPVYVETSARTLDLGTDRLGRVDAGKRTAFTPVTFDFTGLTPWTTGLDQIECFSSGGSSVAYLYGTWGGLDPFPAGATSATNRRQWPIYAGLIDASKGDISIFHQLSARTVTVGGVPHRYRAADKAFTTSAFTVTNGVASSTLVPLAPVAASSSFAVDWRGTQYASHLAAMSPAAVNPVAVVAVEGMGREPGPGIPLLWGLGGWPDLLSVDVPVGSDVNYGTLAFGDVLPAPWGKFLLVRLNASVSVTAAGASTPASISLYMESMKPIASAIGPITPVITPPLAVRVNGADASTGVRGVGAAPVVTWIEPSIFPAGSLYDVTVTRIYADATGTTATAAVASFSTASRSLQIPPGMLQDGEEYLIRVAARWTPDFRFDVQPFRQGVPNASAGTVTGILTTTATRTVSGTQVYTYWADAGNTDVNGNGGTVSISYLSGGGSVSTPPTPITAGAFSFTNVPWGPYRLTYRSTPTSAPYIIDTDARTVDLGQDILGRIDQARAALPTPVTLDFSNMAPWTAASDQIEIVSSNAGAVGYPVGSFGFSDLTDGVTAGSYEDDWSVDTATLIDASKGDVTYFHQLATRYAAVGMASYPYIAADRSWSTNAFTVVDGVASSFAVPFQPVTTTSAVDVDWRGSQFAAHLADLGPAAVPASASFSIGGSARGAGFPYLASTYGGWPDLLAMFIVDHASDVNFGTLTYGSVLPDPWSEFATGRYPANVAVTAAGAVTPAQIGVGLGFTEPVGTTPGPIVPRLTPVRSITVNGQPGFGTLTGVGFTPTVAWTPPAVSPGELTYRVTVRRLDLVNGTRTSVRTVATLVTGTPSVQIPAGILETGKQYVFMVTASWEPGVPRQSQVFRHLVESLSATSVTSVFTP